ncbi:C69 family dipeptidase [Furfurilactobacillus entadae]|uniref:C69 family dipeptidase n=1 Tax=Furfurilactobacillus entadae TaxID=2922307 RepID=UPI0035EA71C8
MSLSEFSTCTTILVGKNASYDGSTLIARNEDAGTAVDPKKFIVVKPDDQPRDYHAKLSKLTLTLPDDPLRYTAIPNAVPDSGIWGEAGINSENIAMSATETITTNERVLGADPLVADGLGEEDLLTITLPYIHSAREGVTRVGQLLKDHGTYETNGIIFSDLNEIWYMETAGGHHWVAQRVPDDAYVVAPNQTGIQEVNFADTSNFMFADDLETFAEENHLNLGDHFNFREIFGSHSQLDHHYNTPRAWYAQRYFSPDSVTDKTPMSDDLPFICRADRKITIEDIKFVLSSHYQDTPYDPFAVGATKETAPFRPIGINRTQELCVLQLRPNVPAERSAIQWVAMAANPFNTLVPFFTNVTDTPASYRDTTAVLDSNNAYWANRLISLITADHFQALISDVESYQEKTLGYGHHRVNEIDAVMANQSGTTLTTALTAANQETADHIMAETAKLLATLVGKGGNLVPGAFTRDNY